MYAGFLGAHQHIVDEKGRVVMPAKFRSLLENGAVITPSPDTCLHVYPVETFEEEVAELLSGRRSNPTTRARARALLGAASKQTLDAQGRMMLPVSLRERGGIDREVAVVGVGAYLEIWDAAAWLEEEARAAAILSEHREPAEEEGT